VGSGRCHMVPVQEVIAHRVFTAFAVFILLRATGRDIERRHFDLRKPLPRSAGDKFLTVVRMYICRGAVLNE
jgi:hypothetical protein